ALNYLEERGDLKLEVAGSRMGYRRLREVVTPNPADSPTDHGAVSEDGAIDLRALTRKLADQFLERERRDVERTATVVGFVRHKGCRTQALLEYFGEPLAGACGHCDTCLGQREGRLSDPHERGLAAEEVALIQKVKSERHPALATPRQLARFLCGITSPAATRAKLTKDYRFGRLADVPFAVLLEASK
ncbi:MAG TPA: RecQ family zinc-binding domain-containing protein, partial [Tepidisphaeraceae bacterium]|nr:RecQ family zinc-binding domain-containing protein [Tepidisphaeraceae bacterium]